MSYSLSWGGGACLLSSNKYEVMETAFYQRKLPSYKKPVTTRFPALCTSHTFPCSFQWSLVFPRFALVIRFLLFSPSACFPALCTGSTSPRSFHRPLVFPCSAPAIRFRALFTGYPRLNSLNPLHICSRA